MNKLDVASDSHSVPVDSVLRILRAHADNPSAFLALNSGNSYFTMPDIRGVIAYRRAGHQLVQLGGVFGPAADRAGLLAAFVAFAAGRRCKVVAVQVQAADRDCYLTNGFTVNQVGASYAVDLAGCTLRGARFMQLRNKISRARRAGLTVLEADQPDWAERMATLDANWLRSKGKHAKPLRFLVGEYGGPVQRHRRLFVGLVDGRLAGYISYSPVYGGRPGWLHDLSRRLVDGPPGVMEAINKAAIDAFRGEGVPWLHFGFTPFTGLDPRLEVPSRSGWFRWLVNQLRARGDAVYPARTQLAYKQKWDPIPLPEYIAFSDGASLRAFLAVFSAANAL